MCVKIQCVKACGLWKKVFLVILYFKGIESHPLVSKVISISSYNKQESTANKKLFLKNSIIKQSTW